MNNLNKRFDKIYVLYDNDVAGINGSNKMVENYKVKQIFIPKETKCKDISDYCKIHKLEKTKELVNNLINEQSL
jgi:hypothetical protein